MCKHARAGALLAAIAFATPAMANEDVLQQTAKPEQWVLQTGDYANQRYSKLAQINRDNVKNLKVAWTFSTGVLRGHEGAPLVVGNIMYVHTPFPNTLYALDLNEDGKILWKYEPKQDPSVIPVMCCDTVYRGPAYADGTIYHHQADTTLVALDAKTGKEKWKIGGGTAWGWFSYDPQTNLVYYGTANPSTWNPAQRAGADGKPIDQKWTMAIIARDADTGMAKWAYQMTPFDEWDYDGVNEMI